MGIPRTSRGHSCGPRSKTSGRPSKPWKKKHLGADIHDPNTRTSMTPGGAKKASGRKLRAKFRSPLSLEKVNELGDDKSFDLVWRAQVQRCTQRAAVAQSSAANSTKRSYARSSGADPAVVKLPKRLPIFGEGDATKHFSVKKRVFQ